MLNRALDYETLPKVHSVQVRAIKHDKSGMSRSVSAAVNITVSDLNDNVPQFSRVGGSCWLSHLCLLLAHDNLCF